MCLIRKYSFKSILAPLAHDVLFVSCFLHGMADCFCSRHSLAQRLLKRSTGNSSGKLAEAVAPPRDYSMLCSADTQSESVFSRRLRKIEVASSRPPRVRRTEIYSSKTRRGKGTKGVSTALDYKERSLTIYCIEPVMALMVILNKACWITNRVPSGIYSFK